MTRLSRYVTSTIGSSIAIVLVLVVGLDIISAIIDQSGELRGRYTFIQSIYYVLLTVPGSVSEYVPLSVLIGCLAGMGVLASNSEVIVMRAAGVSLLRLTGYAARPALAIVVLSLLISEFVSPVTDRWAEAHRDTQLWGESHSLISSRGLWQREGQTYMHFNVLQPGGVLLGVTFFEFDDKRQLQFLRSARRASYLGNRWLLENVTETQFASNKISTKKFKTRSWETDLTPDRLVLLASEPNDMAPTQLYRYIGYLEKNGLDGEPYRLAFWQKLLQPLAVFSLLLIALSFVFGPLRTATMGFRVFIGVVVGIAFQFSQNLLGPSSLVYGFSPMVAVLIPIGICFVMGLVLLNRSA